jgi:hypothetical protein
MRMPIQRLLALAPHNDPFYAGAPAQRAKAQWFAGLFARFNFARGVHLRRIHYALASQKPPLEMPDGELYLNTHRCWGELGQASEFARHLGLVDVGAFDDRRNPEPHLVPGRPDGYEGNPACEIDAFWGEWKLPSIPTDFSVALDLPSIEVYGYDYCQADQPFHVEVWVEKSTMNDVLIPLCRRLGVTLVTGLGFQSITSVVQMLQRIERPTRIFYISDFDPAGDQMPVAVARQVEYYLREIAPDTDIKLTSLVLTKDQVVRYNLPRIPIKDSDKRKGDFEDRRGEGAVELDAMEALYPGELARIVEEAVRPYRDETLERRLGEAEREVRRVVEEVWDNQLAQPREELAHVEQRIQGILDCYRDALTNLNTMLQADLAPHFARLEQLRLTVADIVTRFRENPPELPERPEPETEEPDEQRWLYASDRDYMEQMKHYRDYKGGKHVRSLDKACPACGAKFTPRKRQTYCSAACRTRACRARRANGTPTRKGA